MVGLSACGENVDYETQIAELQTENDSLYAEIEELQSQLDDKSGIDTESPTTISSYNTEAEVEEVGNVTSKVQVDGLLEYTGAVQAPNTASINLLDTATIEPTNNWSIRMDGTTTYYSHPAGVVGVIKMSHIDDEIPSEYYEDEFIKPFLDALPQNGVSRTSRIYVDTKYAGISAEASLSSSETPAILKFGVFGRNETACVYCFYYEGKKDATKSELVDTLIKSMKVNKLEVKIE